MHDQGRRRVGLVTVQGKGRINNVRLDCPKLIRFHELTEDEVFCTEEAAQAGVTYENTSTVEPLVLLRYFGPKSIRTPPKWVRTEKQDLVMNRCQNL